jgi:hypothetical protein
VTDSPADVTVELDMGFSLEEVASGIERLIAPAGAEWSRQALEPGVRFQAREGTTIDLAAMPEERIRHPIQLPRTLLVLRGPRAAVESLHRRVLYAFLRVGG